jgi:hypothetical protein
MRVAMCGELYAAMVSRWCAVPVEVVSGQRARRTDGSFDDEHGSSVAQQMHLLRKLTGTSMEDSVPPPTNGLLLALHQT